MNRMLVTAHAVRTVVGSVPEVLTIAVVASGAAPVNAIAASTRAAPKDSAVAHSQPSPATRMTPGMPVATTIRTTVATPVRNASSRNRPLPEPMKSAYFLVSSKLGVPRDDEQNDADQLHGNLADPDCARPPTPSQTTHSSLPHIRGSGKDQ